MIKLHRFVVFLFGGEYQYRWRPNLFVMIRRYYKEDWKSCGYTLRDFLSFRPHVKLPRKFTGKDSDTSRRNV